MDSPDVFFDSEKDFRDFLDVEKEWMYNRIFEAICFAQEMAQSEAYICTIHVEETDTILYMNSPRSEWENSLTLALNWCIEQEKYEMCNEIVLLIKDIRTPLLGP